MRGLDAATLQRFVELAGERLGGDWVIVGGAVLPLIGGPLRATLDIDVCGPDDAGQAETNALLQIALDLELPVEAINQSAGFFLRKVPDWRDHLDVVHRGPRAVLHVPDATLYVLLKIERLSESDLDDCRAMLRLARSRNAPVDSARLLAALDAQPALSAPKEERARALRELLGRS